MSRSLAETMVGFDELRVKIDSEARRVTTARIDVSRVITALNSFSDCVRYLNTRRSGGALLTLDNEAAVQDALYLMLRPWIIDLVSENPTDRVANRFAMKDFLLRSNQLVIEA